MIVAGLDPGTQHFGYCFLDVTRGVPIQLQVEAIGDISPSHLKTRVKRLETIWFQLRDLFLRFRGRIEVISMEQAHVRKGKYASAAVPLGEARGVAMSIAFEFQIPVVEYTPSQARKYVLAKGNSSKKDVKGFAQRLLPGISGIGLSDDASDAACLAVAEAWNPERGRKVAHA